MQHADTPGDGLGRRRESYLTSIDKDTFRIGSQIAGKDLHQGGLAGPVLSQQSLDRPTFPHQRDAVIGMDGTKIFSDIDEFDLHPP